MHRLIWRADVNPWSCKDVCSASILQPQDFPDHSAHSNQIKDRENENWPPDSAGHCWRNRIHMSVCWDQQDSSPRFLLPLYFSVMFMFICFSLLLYFIISVILTVLIVFSAAGSPSGPDLVSDQLEAILVSDQGYHQVGPPDLCTDMFVLSVTVAFASSLEHVRKQCSIMSRRFQNQMLVQTQLRLVLVLVPECLWETLDTHVHTLS